MREVMYVCKSAAITTSKDWAIDNEGGIVITILVPVKEKFEVTSAIRKACLEKYGFVNSVTVAKTRKALGL